MFTFILGLRSHIIPRQPLFYLKFILRLFKCGQYPKIILRSFEKSGHGDDRKGNGLVSG